MTTATRDKKGRPIIAVTGIGVPHGFRLAALATIRQFPENEIEQGQLVGRHGRCNRTDLLGKLGIGQVPGIVSPGHLGIAHGRRPILVRRCAGLGDDPSHRHVMGLRVDGGSLNMEKPTPMALASVPSFARVRSKNPPP